MADGLIKEHVCFVCGGCLRMHGLILSVLYKESFEEYFEKTKCNEMTEHLMFFSANMLKNLTFLDVETKVEEDGNGTGLHLLLKGDRLCCLPYVAVSERYQEALQNNIQECSKNHEDEEEKTSLYHS